MDNSIDIFLRQFPEIFLTKDVQRDVWDTMIGEETIVRSPAADGCHIVTHLLEIESRVTSYLAGCPEDDYLSHIEK